jgi:hypothetical protein
MRFSSKEDIEAPIEQVFDMLSEFEFFERSAIRRGVEVVRTDNHSAPAAGHSWHARFVLRGRTRDLDLNLVQYVRPTEMLFESDSSGIKGMFEVELLALSSKRTRLAVVLDLSPKTLSARLLIQSLRLAKSNLTKRFKLRVADFSKELEDRCQRRRA